LAELTVLINMQELPHTFSVEAKTIVFSTRRIITI